MIYSRYLMKIQKEKIIKLIQHSFLISAETKEFLLEKVEGLSEVQVSAMLDSLLEAEKKQQEILEQAVKNNPELVTELEEVLRKGLKEKRASEERKEKVKERKALADLEKLLEQQK